MSKIELLEKVHYNFDGQINLFKFNNSKVSMIEFFFFEKKIIFRQYLIDEEENSNLCEDLKLQTLNRSESLIDIIIDYIYFMISEEEYDIEII